MDEIEGLELPDELLEDVTGGMSDRLKNWADMAINRCKELGFSKEWALRRIPPYLTASDQLRDEVKAYVMEHF